MVPPSNFLVLVVGDSREHFDAAMALAMAGHSKVTHYEILQDDAVNNGIPALTLFWSAESKASALPFPMTSKGATDFAFQWLLSLEDDAFGEKDDCDGSFKRGFRVDNDVSHTGWRYGVCTIRPEWGYYGK